MEMTRQREQRSMKRSFQRVEKGFGEEKTGEKG